MTADEVMSDVPAAGARLEMKDEDIADRDEVPYFSNRRLMFGLEYLFGRRENRNGASGYDNRLQLSSQVSF